MEIFDIEDYELHCLNKEIPTDGEIAVLLRSLADVGCFEDIHEEKYQICEANLQNNRFLVSSTAEIDTPNDTHISWKANSIPQLIAQSPITQKTTLLEQYHITNDRSGIHMTVNWLVDLEVHDIEGIAAVIHGDPYQVDIQTLNRSGLNTIFWILDEFKELDGIAELQRDNRSIYFRRDGVDRWLSPHLV